MFLETIIDFFTIIIVDYRDPIPKQKTILVLKGL